MGTLETLPSPPLRFGVFAKVLSLPKRGTRIHNYRNRFKSSDDACRAYMEKDHPMEHVIEECWRIMVYLGRSIQHTYREGNFRAKLANLGGNQEQLLCILEQPLFEGLSTLLT
ncbi:hypothetical protein LguiA_020016 [Lonicera macranthoides]